MVRLIIGSWQSPRTWVSPGIINLEHFEDWNQKGFEKAKKGEYPEFSAEEGEKVIDLLERASLRK